MTRRKRRLLDEIIKEWGCTEAKAKEILRQRRWDKAKGVLFPIVEDVIPLGRTLTKGAKVVESAVRNIRGKDK